MFTTQPSKSAERLADPCLMDQQGNSPLLLVNPHVANLTGGCGVAWAADGPGHQLALGFIYLGFQVNQEASGYLLPLDAETDALLLRLYDLIASLRWRAPQRQLHLLEALLPLSQEVCDG